MDVTPSRIRTLRGPFSGALIQQLERLFQHGTAVGLTEGELLERFVQDHDEAAFEALIARHGPMVLGVCRQLLRDPNDVDDAFQATFLVLVRKAGTLRRCDLLGNWLYGVAYRVATRARLLAARRLAKVPHGQEMVDRLERADGRRGAGPQRSWGERDELNGLDPEPRPWLHEEVGRLPAKYRIPVVLCYFEGLTHEEAARRLGWPLGTVKGRLARARDLLRKRLTRRGLTLSAAALASQLAVPDARAAVPASLALATLQAAQAVAGTAGGSIATAAAVSLPVAALTEGVLQAMITTKLKALALPLLVLGAVTTSVVIGATQVISHKEEPDPSSPAASQAAEVYIPAAQPSPEKGKFKEARAKGSTSSAQTKEVESPAAQGAAGVGGAAAAGGTGGMMQQMMRGMRGGRVMGGGMVGRVFNPEEAGRVFNPEEARRVFNPEEARELIEFQNRIQITQLAAALAATDKNPESQAILRKLQEPIPMSFANQTPLNDVLKYLKQATTTKTYAGLPIYVDPIGLQQAERSLNSTVTIDLEGIPLKTSLRLLLKQLGLAYCIRDGVLIISSVQGIREELAEAASELQVSDPTAGGGMMQQMIQQMSGMSPFRQ